MIKGKQAARKKDLNEGAAADEALEAARTMPPGPERNAAWKEAGFLRHAADSYGVIFAKRGRPTR